MKPPQSEPSGRGRGMLSAINSHGAESSLLLAPINPSSGERLIHACANVCLAFHVMVLVVINLQSFLVGTFGFPWLEMRGCEMKIEAELLSCLLVGGTLNK